MRVCLVIVLIEAVASFRAFRRPQTARISGPDPSSYYFAATPRPDDSSPSSTGEYCETSFLESLNEEDEDPVEEISPFYRRDTRERIENPNALRLPPLTDPAGLASLLEERHYARQSGNYLLVSDLDRQLKQKYGVKAYDHPPVWTRILSSPPTAFRRRQAQKQKRLMERAFGPAGHLYQQVLVGERHSDNGIFCDLTMAEIHALLRRRTLCGAGEEADAIKLELSIHGVRVCDETLQWTTDPTVDFEGNKRQATISINRQQHQSTSSASAMQHYNRDPLSKPFEEEPIRFQQRVEQLVQARSDALVRGEVELAESLALELYCSYEVGVSDHTRTWSVGCQFLTDAASLTERNPPRKQPVDTSNSSNEKKEETYKIQFPSSRLLFGDKERDFASETRYRCSSQSLPMPKQFKQRIEDLVQDRIHKREEGRFLEADAIRRELWRTYNVGVNDKLQQYSVGGIYDSATK